MQVKCLRLKKFRWHRYEESRYIYLKLGSHDGLIGYYNTCFDFYIDDQRSGTSHGAFIGNECATLFKVNNLAMNEDTPFVLTSLGVFHPRSSNESPYE